MNDPITAAADPIPLIDTGTSRINSRFCQNLLTAALALICTIPILAVHTPPLTDALGHVGRFSLQLELGSEPWLQQFYSFQWRIIGNLGSDILVQLLGPIVGIVAAVKTVLFLTQFLAGLAIVLIAREVHGRITALSLFALPFIYNFPFNFGFLNFTLSMSLALMGFVLWLKLGRRQAWLARGIAFAALSLVVWVSHVYGWVFLGILCTGSSLAEARADGRAWLQTLWQTAWRCAPLLTPVIPMLAWRGGEASPGIEGWFQMVAKLVWLISPLRLEDMWIDICSAVFVGVVLLYAYRFSRLPHRPAIAWALGIAMLAFMMLPSRVFGSTFADMRLVPYLFILALLAYDPAPLSRRRRTLLTGLGLAFLGLRLALTTGVYIEHERKLDGYLEALSVIPQHSRVMTLMVAPCGWGLPWVTHLGSVAIATRQSFANDQWEYPGMNLLSIHYPAAGDFVSDSSEVVAPIGKPGDQRCTDGRKDLADKLASFPAGAFTRLWIANLDPRDFPRRPDLKPLWSGPDSIVYEIVHQPADDPRPPRPKA